MKFCRRKIEVVPRFSKLSQEKYTMDPRFFKIKKLKKSEVVPGSFKFVQKTHKELPRCFQKPKMAPKIILFLKKIDSIGIRNFFKFLKNYKMSSRFKRPPRIF